MDTTPTSFSNVNYVQELILNWRRCLPIHIGDLFTYSTKDGIQRFDSFQLDPNSILFIVNILNKRNSIKGGNINNISVVMGKGEWDEDKLVMPFEPSSHIFRPILEVILQKPHNGQRKYYFVLNPVTEPFSLYKTKANRLKIAKQRLNTLEVLEKEQISPKVAELFILKWQSLTDGEVINSFEGMAADSITLDEKGETAKLKFGSQKLLRVNQYTFDKKETKEVIGNLEEILRNNYDVNFYVYFGSGLEVRDFHPFSFRPILKLVSNSMLENLEKDSEEQYYDTSRPCPPYCPATILGGG